MTFKSLQLETNKYLFLKELKEKSKHDRMPHATLWPSPQKKKNSQFLMRLDIFVYSHCFSCEMQFEFVKKAENRKSKLSENSQIPLN